MYNIFTQTKSITLAAVAATSILIAGSSIAAVAATSIFIAGSVLAGPGKPGENSLAPGGNIVEVASAANAALDVFNTVLTAATCPFFEGAVVDILTGNDKVTLFAPIDPAFAELGLFPNNVCEAFDGSDDAVGSPADLLGILAYHVSDGRRFSNSVFNKNGNAKAIEMLTGGYIITAGGNIYDNQGQEIGIVAPYFDINASNGVIHTIDTVMLP